MATVTAPLRGLSEHEASLRRTQGRGNNVDLGTSRSYQQILFHNLFTFVNTVLFGIGAILIALGLPGDAAATAGLVVINVVVGVAQEIRAKHKLDQIALLTRPKITAIRDGQEKQIDPSGIVEGDVLLVRAGDQIVVDGTISNDGKIEVDESLLTGESDHVQKQHGDTVYSGSFCITGTATYEVTKVGAESYANKLTTKARGFRITLTPLQRSVNFLVRLLALISVMMGLLLYLAAFRDHTPVEDRVLSLAVVVGLIPQGLIFLTTLSYALGAVRIAGHGALVQQSSAVESMSNINVLCLDKTGTLTTNRIQLHDVHPLDLDSEKFRLRLGTYAASVTDSNRTNDAIRAACPGEAYPAFEEIPFSSARKWSSLTFEREEVRGTWVLGAPEILQPYVSNGLALNDQIELWASEGLRVVMFAHHSEVKSLQNGSAEPDLPHDLKPLGLIAFSDELRPEAQHTLRDFASAGISLKVISGDNPQTVAALAKQVEFPGIDEVHLATGTDIAHLSDEDLAQTAERATIFGRITPYQKERLVKALQSRGHYVAMIGDGVNDVLSLKQAQLGIAMESGSSATRNAADIVLLNDSFSVLPQAFKEGQRILNGMQDITRILLTRTFYMVLLILAAGMIDVAFPLYPKYDVIVATLTVGIPGPALAMWARPGKKERGLLSSIVHFVIPAAFTVACFGFAIYFYYLETADIATARTVLTAFLTLSGLMLLPFVEPPTPIWVAGDEYSGDWRPTYLAIVMTVLLAILLFVPSVRDSFELVRLNLLDYVLMIGTVGLWGWTLRLIWLHRVFERFLGIDL